MPRAKASDLHGRRASLFDVPSTNLAGRPSLLLWASSIDVNGLVTSLDPPRNPEAGATERRDPIGAGVQPDCRSAAASGKSFWTRPSPLSSSQRPLRHAEAPS